MRATYDDAMQRGVFPHEGGYTNDSLDPGGATNWGITIADARAYWKPGATVADVRAMPKSVAQDIYAKHYAAPLRYDDLPAGVDYSVLDYGINSGVGRAGKVLRRLAGLPDIDSAVTDEVISAVAKLDPKTLINAINDERLAFLKSLKTWRAFGAGWSHRVTDVRALSLAFAADTRMNAAPGSTAEPGMKKMTLPAGTQAGALGGIAAAGAAAAQQADHSGVRLAVVFVICAVAAMLAVGGWLAWQRYRQRRQTAVD